MKKFRILLDLDCVLADFVGPAASFHGFHISELIPYYWTPGEYGMSKVIGKALGREFTEEDFWRPINSKRGFWSLLPILPWAQDVFDLVTKATDNWWIVTSPSKKCRECIPEKEEWLYGVFGPEAARKMVPTRHKELFAVAKDRDVILIDDYDVNVTKFREAGGSGILFPSHHNPLYEAKDDPLKYVTKMLEVFTQYRT